MQNVVTVDRLTINKQYMKRFSNIFKACALGLFLLLGCKQLTQTADTPDDSMGKNHKYKYFCVSSSLLELDDTTEKVIVKSEIKLKVHEVNGKLMFDTRKGENRIPNIRNGISEKCNEVSEGYNIYSGTGFATMREDSLSCILIYHIYLSHDKIAQRKNSSSLSIIGNIDGHIQGSVYIKLDGKDSFSVEKAAEERHYWARLKIKENEAGLPQFLEKTIDTNSYRVRHRYYLE
jgi:hypothetical protein